MCITLTLSYQPITSGAFQKYHEGSTQLESQNDLSCLLGGLVVKRKNYVLDGFSMCALCLNRGGAHYGLDVMIVKDRKRNYQQKLAEVL